MGNYTLVEAERWAREFSADYPDGHMDVLLAEYDRRGAELAEAREEADDAHFAARKARKALTTRDDEMAQMRAELAEYRRLFRPDTGLSGGEDTPEAVQAELDRLRTADLAEAEREFRQAVPDSYGDTRVPDWALVKLLAEYDRLGRVVDTREEWAVIAYDAEEESECIEFCATEEIARRQLTLHYSGSRHRHARVVHRGQPIAPEAPWVEVDTPDLISRWEPCPEPATETKD